MPELIQDGRVYGAVPPLFGIKQKGGMKYFTTKLDFTKYVQNLFAHTYSLADEKGKKLSNSETTNLFFKNIDYKDQIEFVANTFAIDPDLLESVLYYISDFIELGSPEGVAHMAAKVKAVETAKKKAAVTKKAASKKTTKATTSKTATTKSKKNDTEIDDEVNYDEIPITEGSVSASVSYYIKPSFSFTKFKNAMKKKYRFLDMYEKDGIICIQGLVNSKYQYVFLNNKFISACAQLITLIKNSTGLFYRVNGELVTLYGLMSKFDAMIPSGLVRYKGLGEQDPEQLGVSALRPDGDRTLIRYTTESAKEEIENLRRVDSGMASLLREVRITKAEIE